MYLYTMLRDGSTGDLIPLGARFSPPVQNTLCPNQPPIQWVPGHPGGKVAGAWRQD